ncbi:MAG TPA: helix-turn-helix domain-containing protein [Solirubrobacteraceae bacterium]|jgi:excisionase family DNA binding protein
MHQTNTTQPPPANPGIQLAQPLLRPEEAAELLAVKPSWIYEAVRTRQLPCLRIGRHIRFTHTQLENWLLATAVEYPPAEPPVAELIADVACDHAASAGVTPPAGAST